MKKQYLFLIFLPISIIAKHDYSKIISNIKNNDYTQAFTSFDSIKQRDARYWYFYACLCHKQLIDNILSDDVEEYFNNTLSAYKKVFDFNDFRYRKYAEENLVSLYNLYMRRGVAYIKRILNREAVECFRHANIIFPNDKAVQIKILYTNILQNITVNIPDVDDILYKYLSLYLHISQKNYDKALEKIKSILQENKYDLFALKYLHQVENFKDAEKQYIDNNKIYSAVIFYIDNNFKQAYDILKTLSVDDINLKKIYCEVMYKYCQELQTNKAQKDLFTKIAHKCIGTCKDIFYKNHDDTKVLRILYFLYMSLDEVKSAEGIIKYHNIKI